MQFDLVTRAPDAHFNKIAKQDRDHDEIDPNDVQRRQPTDQRYDMSVPAAGTKPRGSAAGENDSRRNAKSAGVRFKSNRLYENNGCFFRASKVASSNRLPSKPAENGGERRPWPKPPPDPHTTAAAAVQKGSRSAYAKQDNQDVPYA